MTLDLARKLAIPAIEGDIDFFDASNAEEMFLTSTSLCIAGVCSFNGAKIGDGRARGPVTKRLTDAYIAEVGCDFVKQYLDRLSKRVVTSGSAALRIGFVRFYRAGVDGE
jgi:branched-chain amino acid aminotransferase